MSHRYRFKFNLKNAWRIEPVYDRRKVSAYKACWNGSMAWREDQLRDQVFKLDDRSKSLGKYLAKYRDNCLTVKGDEFYDQQITMLEGMKARKAKAAKLLKKIKTLRKMEPTVQSIVKDLNKTLPVGMDVADWDNIDKAEQEAIKQFNERLDVIEPFVKVKKND